MDCPGGKVIYPDKSKVHCYAKDLLIFSKTSMDIKHAVKGYVKRRV